MTLPQRKLYTIADLAGRWNVHVSDIQDYLMTGILQASINLPSMMMITQTYQIFSTSRVI